MTSIVGSVWFAGAQDTGDQQQEADASPIHQEVPDGPFIPARLEDRRTSPAQRWIRNGYVSVQVNVDEFGNNILGDAANEPSIAVDPTNRDRKAIGWRQFDVGEGNFRQAGWGYTADGGDTWTFPGALEPGVFRSDPVLDSDADGRFFFYSLTADMSCQLFKSINGGITWDEGIDAYGGDKPWMTIDRTDGVGRNNIYMAWGYSLTRSYDGGQTFRAPVHVAAVWGTLAVGPDGELYAASTHPSPRVRKSSTIQDESQPVSWDPSTLVDLGGEFGSSGPNLGGLQGQAWIAVDHSAGPTRGNVYLLGSVEPPGPDPLDVMFASSTDGGQTWSAPVRVNHDPQDNGAWQWFGTMSVAPNGRIDVIWNDTRNDPGGYDSEVYYARSDDGGQTWSANEAISPAFDPRVGWDKLGDYCHMVSDNGGADLAYAATFNGEHDVYYLRIGGDCANAGTCGLDRRAYACEDTARVTVLDCGLNADDELAETVVVTVESGSEPAGEDLVLTETGVDSARFVGWIPLSETDAFGVLHVAETDTVIATYDDTDDGTGNPATMTDTAVIDCTPPAVFDVQTGKTRPAEVTVTFETDEHALSTVRYGTSCAALTQSAPQSAGYRIEHSITLTQLESERRYFFVIDVEDLAGNHTTDDDGGLCYQFRTMTPPQQIARLLPDDGAGDDRFGCSVAISGNTVVIGADGDDDNGIESGSAYVFHYDGSGWEEEAKLLTSDGYYKDYFGRSVAISGDTAVIGADWDDDNGGHSGSAYVFHRNGPDWVEEAKLLASDGQFKDYFGYSVSIFADTAVIGAYGDDDNGNLSGSAYVFHRNGSDWVQEAKLLASDGHGGNRFAFSVSISGDTAVIGARSDNDNGGQSGSAYVFRFNGSSWVQEAKLLADDGAEGDGFGRSVSISDDTAVIGARGDDDNGDGAGSAYCFRYDGSDWVQEAKLLASDGGEGNGFGQSVSVVGDTVVIGATPGLGPFGSAYVFRFNGSSWGQEAKLPADDVPGWDYFGNSVCISGEMAVIGAPEDRADRADSGSVYVFQLGCPRRGDSGNHCTGDVYPNNGDGVWLRADDGDCIIDIRDLGQLLANYAVPAGATREHGDVYPIGSGDGAIDVLDLLTVLAQYGDACN